MEKLNCVAIIPVRYNSTRFPGKPLTPILDKPMMWHTYNRVQNCQKIQKTFITTDDQRISNKAKELNIPYIITSDDHKSGTDRVREAADILNLPENTIVINIQGDEPCFPSTLLDKMINRFQYPEVKVCTGACPLDIDDVDDPNSVKVVQTYTNKALYFSRSPIPYTNEFDSHFLHIGIYAFRLPVLQKFSQLPNSPLEKLEKLEQLRLLEANIPIHIVNISEISHSVDSIEDISKVQEILLQEK